jgi:transcription initiation factor TFIIB
MSNKYSDNITQKKRERKINKAKLWETFDAEINGETPNLECVYSNCENTNREYCELCKSTLFYSSEKFLVCSNKKCGIIYNDVLDNNAEWRYYGADDSQLRDPTRCGMPINPLLKISSYGCKVICNSRSSWEMRKIRRYTEWQSMPYKEKSQYDEFETIKIMAYSSGIPKIIVDEALRQHKKLSELKTFRGCNRDGIIAASVYVSCRIHNNPRTPKEIASIFKLDNTSATKGCKNAIYLLNKTESNKEMNDKTHFHQTKPIAFIERFCSKLNINKELTTLCKFIAKKIEKLNQIPENTPHSVAAGIVYFVAQVCHLNISKKQIKNCSEISEVTINKCFKKLEKINKVPETSLLPSCILKKYSL